MNPFPKNEGTNQDDSFGSSYFFGSGAILVVIAAILWSTGGVLIKSVSLDAFQISFWRSFFAIATILIIYKPNSISSDKVTIFGSLAFASTLILFVLATKFTTAANAILLQYTAPIYILILSPFLLHEKPTVWQMLTITICFIGMGIFFFEGISKEGFYGNVFALLSGISFALMTILLRKKKDERPIDVILLGSGWIVIICSSVVMWQASFNPKGLLHEDVYMGFAISTADSIMVLALGVFQIGIPYLLFSKGIKTVKALDASLIGMLEPVLNPILVILFVGEKPSINAIIGGAIILIAVFLQSLLASLRKVQDV
ncbi:MAG: DMT family transporter [Chloroherpetonaceae bacterium]|nr:DMT family transporter [Chloroherpetonaceae bacterium]